MEMTVLGRTGLSVTRTAFGVLPLQRVESGEATRILRRAFDAGITLYDTARGYTDSEEKIGMALSDVRDRIVIATKSGATTKSGVLSDLETSLRNLHTDHVDILQLHNPTVLPDLSASQSTYAGLLEARDKGMARYIGITSHSRERAVAAVESGAFDTLQFPFNHLSSAEDLALVELCRQHNVGLIGMKPLSGGLLTNARTAFAFLRQFANLVPIWGVQRMSELEELLSYDSGSPILDQPIMDDITKDRQELAGDFCRACGYCLPCPAGIPIPMAARMGLLLRRMPAEQFLTPHWQGLMQRIETCTDCGHCRAHCPYGLDAPDLLKKMLAEYNASAAALTVE